jgi:hypothetical protein
MESEITSLKNKLIIYKTTGKLPPDIVEQIQDILLNGRKQEDFESMLERVEQLIKK